MAKTEAEFNATFARWQTAAQNLFNATNGRTAAMQGTKGGIDNSVDLLGPLVQRAESLLSGGGTGGGTVTPSTSSLALVKAAMLTAPTTYAAVPASNVMTVIQGVPGELPAYPGGLQPVLHYFRPPPDSGWTAPDGSPDVLVVGKFPGAETFSYAFNGDSSWTQNGGRNHIARMWAPQISSHKGGIKINGRYLSVNTRFATEKIWVWVNGDIQPTVTVAQNDCWTTFDFGSRASRNIITDCGQNEFGGYAVPAGDTIEPYDFTVGKYRRNRLGDSWTDRRDYENRNLRAPDISALLTGSHSIGGYYKGGTGYLENASDADDDQRRLDMRGGNPNHVDLRMMANDPDPQANAALQPRVRKVFEYIRADAPTAVFQVVAWTSSGSRSTVVGGETRKRDLFRAEWDRMTGPKVFIDCLEGTWYADAGNGAGVKTRATKLGPMITGEGSKASPTGSGNADTLVEDNAGRHLTSPGVEYSEQFVARLEREALAVM